MIENIKQIDFTNKGYRKSRAPIKDPQYYGFNNMWYKVFRDCEYLCQCNEKLQFVIKETLMSLPNYTPTSANYEIGMIHEDLDGHWADIKFYTLTAEDMGDLDYLEGKVLSAWIAINEKCKNKTFVD